jgi:hypothetical protein
MLRTKKTEIGDKTSPAEVQTQGGGVKWRVTSYAAEVKRLEKALKKIQALATDALAGII